MLCTDFMCLLLHTFRPFVYSTNAKVGQLVKFCAPCTEVATLSTAASLIADEYHAYAAALLLLLLIQPINKLFLIKRISARPDFEFHEGRWLAFLIIRSTLSNIIISEILKHIFCCSVFHGPESQFG